MSDEQVRELGARHGAIGGDGYDHYPFATLDPVLKPAEARVDTNDAPGSKRPLGRLEPRTCYFDEASVTVGA